MNFYKLTILIVFVSSSFSCNKVGAGSFGGWDINVFPVPPNRFDKAIDSLYKLHPTYIMPEKWKAYGEDWIKQGYISKKIYVFYFNESPEKMYYISLVDAGMSEHPEYTRISIRGVKTSDGHWKENSQYNPKERERIEKRFNEQIIKKLEGYTDSKSYKQ